MESETDETKAEATTTTEKTTKVLRYISSEPIGEDAGSIMLAVDVNEDHADKVPNLIRRMTKSFVAHVQGRKEEL